MEFDEFQEKAKETDQFTNKERSLASSMWNIQETLSFLLRKYDAKGRTEVNEEEYKEYVKRKLGDLTWYLANIASSYGMSYNEIIQINLAKTEKRWGKKRQALRFFDEGFTDEEKFPKRLVFRFKEVGGKAEVAHPGKFDDWFRVGDLVTDNNHREDGYRFHDVIHISFMTFLGWSPAMRSLLKKKRKSDPKIDEVEDGARAAILEESISAIIFEFARENSWFEKTDSVPLELLRIIERITRNLEISEATFGHWEKAIIEGYKVFREVRNNNGGYLLSDLEQKSLSYSQDMFDL